MGLVQLRLYTFDVNGREIVTPFTFDPLTDRDAYDYDRETTRAVSRRLRRRPFARQEVREFKLAAGFLLTQANRDNLQRLYDAHKIEWFRSVGGRDTWLEYDLDVEGLQEFERVEDIDPLRRITLKLVQSQPVWFTNFEDKTLRVTDRA